jgi:hypothetical protein
LQPGDALDRRLRQLRLVVSPDPCHDDDRRRGCTGTRQKSAFSEHSNKAFPCTLRCRVHYRADAERRRQNGKGHALSKIAAVYSVATIWCALCQYKFAVSTRSCRDIMIVKFDSIGGCRQYHDHWISYNWPGDPVGSPDPKRAAWYLAWRNGHCATEPLFTPRFSRAAK